MGEEGYGLQIGPAFLSEASRSSDGAGGRTLPHYLLGVGLRPMTLGSVSDLRERQRMRMPEMALAMTRRWTSEVPSKVE